MYTLQSTISRQGHVIALHDNDIGSHNPIPHLDITMMEGGPLAPRDELHSLNAASMRSSGVRVTFCRPRSGGQGKRTRSRAIGPPGGVSGDRRRNVNEGGQVCTWEAACLFQQGEAGCGHTFTHFIALLRATIHSWGGGSPKGREDTVEDLSTTGGEGNQNLIPTLLQ